MDNLHNSLQFAEKGIKTNKTNKNLKYWHYFSSMETELKGKKNIMEAYVN